jgi:hypothetical protein
MPLTRPLDKLGIDINNLYFGIDSGLIPDIIVISVNNGIDIPYIGI